MSNKSGDYEREFQEVSRWMLAGAIAGLVSFFGALFWPYATAAEIGRNRGMATLGTV
jgi:hypothetical protein